MVVLFSSCYYMIQAVNSLLWPNEIFIIIIVCGRNQYQLLGSLHQGLYGQCGCGFCHHLMSKFVSNYCLWSNIVNLIGMILSLANLMARYPFSLNSSWKYYFLLSWGWTLIVCWKLYTLFSVQRIRSTVVFFPLWRLNWYQQIIIPFILNAIILYLVTDGICAPSAPSEPVQNS